MSGDALDGKLGGDVKPPAHGSIADLVARAQAAGFSTIADWVDNLEDIVARYEGRRGMVDRERLVDAAVRATPEVVEWPANPGEKVGFRAPDSGVTFAAGAITKDDWEPGFRRSSGALQPLDDDRPLLRGVDDLREERDQ